MFNKLINNNNDNNNIKTIPQYLFQVVLMRLSTDRRRGNAIKSVKKRILC